MPNNELYHYGVLGMKWGRRNNKTSVKKSKPHKFTNDKVDKKKGVKLKKGAAATITATALTYLGTSSVTSMILNDNTTFDWGTKFTISTIAGYLGALAVADALTDKK